jgi:hypothetical protein
MKECKKTWETILYFNNSTDTRELVLTYCEVGDSPK